MTQGCLALDRAAARARRAGAGVLRSTSTDLITGPSMGVGVDVVIAVAS